MIQSLLIKLLATLDGERKKISSCKLSSRYASNEHTNKYEFKYFKVFLFSYSHIYLT